MKSRTKYFTDSKTIKKMLRKAGIDNCTDIFQLSAGEFNAIYEIRADKNYVLKIAPKTDIPVLTYESNMIKAEIYWYDMIRKNTNIRVPEIYYKDFSKEIIPCDWFIMEKLYGRHPNIINISKNASIKKTAEILAQVHKVHNEKYGYVQNELYSNWYDALRNIIKNLLSDNEKAGRRSKNGEKLLNYTMQYRDILINVPCCMVNYDLWIPNIICNNTDGDNFDFAVIDPERSLWGDRLFDFIYLEKPVSLLGKKKKSISYYNAIADTPIEINRETEIRFAFALGLLALLQETEKFYRYSPYSFGRLRNIAGQIAYYNRAFKVLKNG